MHTSRREFLRSLVATSAAALVPGTAPAFLGACTVASANLDELEARLPGRILRPGAQNYARYTQPWNLRWKAKRPVAQAVVRATSADDVATALRWARETGTALVPRSGGHSYAGYSTTDGILIDVSSMNSVSYDASTGQGTLGGGARNLNVYEALRPVGRTITHGRCYQVGVAGLVLGGGIGFNMRRLGLTCDQLVSTEVVLAHGRILRCNATENADLFWACRGAGGGNFGIHTSFVFTTHPAVDVTYFDITFVSGVEEGLRVLLEEARNAPRALGLKFTLRVAPINGANVIVLNILGQWAGSKAELDAWLAPLRAVATVDPARDRVETLPYWDAQNKLSDEGAPEWSFERSRYVVDELPEKALALVFERLRAWPGVGVSAAWKGYLTGGAIEDVAPDATAFVHRRPWLLSTFDYVWTAENAANAPEAVLASLQWLDQGHEAITPYCALESYQNFIDDSETQWKQTYYGANLPRLVAVKQKYDPTNFFRFPQSIPLSL